VNPKGEEVSVMRPQTIRILCIEDKERGWWSAQCLEYDLAAQAKTFHDLVYEIQRVVTVQVMASKEIGVVPFVNLRAAPAVFWQIYDELKGDAKKEATPFTLMNSSIPSLIGDFVCA
jgi:hypothetical protein